MPVVDYKNNKIKSRDQIYLQEVCDIATEVHFTQKQMNLPAFGYKEYNSITSRLNILKKHNE